ncbi:unnamed protein product [Microthlaspi erraticum]|uniref:Cytochrome P450 n=1 Tax=Microthlaspi erraticum TaxID=1685480 RepID=A0A6D2KZ33_9BRAS|nr:unnamed protein product [Microthlaspi erraticum]
MLLHFGRVPVLVVSSAEVAYDVMKTHDLKFANRLKTKAVNIIMNSGRDVAFSSYGEYWRQLKSVCTVHLLGKKMVKSFEKVREDEVKAMMDRVEKGSSFSLPVNLSEFLLDMSNSVVCRIAMGRKYSREEKTGDFENNMRKIVELLGAFPVGDYIPGLAWVDKIRGLDCKMEQVSNSFMEFLERVVQEHVDHEGYFLRRDINDFHDPRLGNDTSYKTSKLYEKAPRRDQNVFINAWVIHRDTTTWGPDAEEFRPERHLDVPLGFQGQDFKYIPFGSGRRLCPGIGFGLALIEVTLANLVNRFNWRVETRPSGDDDEYYLAETTGIEVCRKFPLIAFPSSS